ncbi:acyltransferase family protein [Methylobacterium sp. NEAU 140]|uniref:acyltransferase family protein n=1 Tax=Methylobacterium sp. NEAU 140 TaxID=3064945 RepID=UPI002732CA7C|nr:acyltransferase family protein [Methylobacterium sp. NEAU 140]MDP4021859.1 acyltransferase family protein [Methylobacterium sp. NEAU 140]
MAGGDEADGRRAWVDIAKGTCILLVVMMHAVLGTGEAMGGEGFLHPVVAFAKPFRIPDFFLLSGLFVGRVIDRDWRLFADRRVAHFAYFYLLWLLILSAAKYGRIVDGAGPEAFLAHLAHALVEPYSTLWFIYLLAVFSVVTKLLRRVPGPALLAGAALLQLADIRSDSTLVEEFCARYVYFVGGYLLARHIFALADRVRARAGLALIGLALWAVAEGWLALTPSAFAGYPTLASLPGVSLVLGAAGALAIVSGAALLDRAGGPVAEALRYCGQRSIVIYLAFTLPMAATREALVRSGLIADVGLVSLAVITVAVLVPLALERLVRGTPLAALFVRPRALHLAAPPPRRASRPSWGTGPRSPAVEPGA